MGISVMAFKSILEISRLHKIHDIIFGGDFNFIPNSMLYDYFDRNQYNLKTPSSEYSNQILVKKINFLQNFKMINQITDKKYQASNQVEENPNL